jgi:hypothetical protein
MEALFPDNPARRVATKKGGEERKGVKKANESDVSAFRRYRADGRLKKVMLRTRYDKIVCDAIYDMIPTEPPILLLDGTSLSA